MKITATIGRNRAGNLETLYLGDDAEKAVQALRDADLAKFSHVAVFRKPPTFKRRQLDLPPANESKAEETSATAPTPAAETAPASVETPAEEPKAEESAEPAPKTGKKKK